MGLSNLIFSKKNVGIALTLSSLLGINSQVYAYCSSQGNNVNYEWINGLEINGQANNSGKNDGYADFSATPISLMTGANSITLTPGFRSAAYTEYWNIWVDINKNNQYDSDELLFSGQSGQEITDTLVLPESAFSGETGMRVSMKYSGYPPVCGSFTYGEVEDYLVSAESLSIDPPVDLDNEAPIVTLVEPSSNAQSVSVNSAIIATFNEPLDSDIVWSNVFKIFDGASEIIGSYSYTENSITFTPSTDLASETLYRVEISNLVSDPSGNTLVDTYKWTFTTDKEKDIDAPQVQTISPMVQEQGVPVNTSVSVTFSEAIAPSSVTETSFSIDSNGEQVLGSLSHNGSTVVFQPNTALSYETLYAVNLSAEITDIAGNSLEDDISWFFETGSAPDTTPPEVLMTSPENLMTNVGVDSLIVANFSEAMNANSLSASTFTLSNGSEQIQGVVNTNNAMATFSPSEPLAYATSYFATLNTGITDLSGNELDNELTWQFSTEMGFSISGAVLVNGVGVENVSINLSGESDAEITTDINGQFTFNNLTPGSYLLTPTLLGYELNSTTLTTDIVDGNVSNLEFNATQITMLSVPSEYSTIKSALESAADGATILVDDGVYYENLVIDKAITIESVNGYQSTSVVSTNGNNVFLVNSPNVTIKGFDLYGAKIFGRAGIYFNEGSDGGKSLNNRCGYDNIQRNYYGVRIVNSDNMEVSGTVCQVLGLTGIHATFTNGSKFIDNVIEGQSFDGIYLSESHNNEIIGNSVASNRNGISLFKSNSNVVTSNTCSDNNEDGIEVNQSNSNSITSNSCNNNQEVGIFVIDSDYNSAHSNQASSNGISGIVFYQSDNGIIEQNQCDKNSAYGLYLNRSGSALVSENACILNGSRGLRLNYADDNTITNNEFNFQQYGVQFNQSSNNIFVGNTVKSQITGIKGCEITMSSSSNNTLYQNSFTSYTVNDVCSNNGSTNSWNSPTEVNYTYNAIEYSAVIGNYYSFSDVEDSNDDGINDLPLSLPGDELDDVGALVNSIEDYLFE